MRDINKHLDFFELLNNLGVDYSFIGIQENTIIIEVQNNLDLSNINLGTIPVKIKSVSGDFICSGMGLTSLENFPDFVGGDFDCSNNDLTSLEGSPQDVHGYFDCSNNKLISLKGCPENVGDYFDCIDNPNLKSLKGLGKNIVQIYSDIYEGKREDCPGEL